MFSAPISSSPAMPMPPLKPIDAVRALLESHRINRKITAFNDNAVLAKVDKEISLHLRETDEELGVEDLQIIEELAMDLQEDESLPIDPDPIVPSYASVISQGYARLVEKSGRAESQRSEIPYRKTLAQKLAQACKCVPLPRHPPGIRPSCAKAYSACMHTPSSRS